MDYNSELNEIPVVTIDEEMLIIHSHINWGNKMILNKEEAMLLMWELIKFTKMND